MVPEAYLGEYALEPDRGIYSGLEPERERQKEEELRGRG
jgi:hypothetical protein